jgi:hypothetical protein
MTNHAALSNVEHKDLRVIAGYGAQYGDDVMGVMTFPAEFREIQAHYPIVFSKSREGEFMPLALFGFREKQNLFLKGDAWDATYVPLLAERQPFLLGRGPDNQTTIHIDLDHPRVSRTQGEPLFREHGGTTEFLDRRNSILSSIHQGLPATQPFVAALVEHNLLESFALDIAFRDGAQHRFAGFYTIHEERLGKLDAQALGRLHERGYLQAMFMVIASLAHFRDLIERASRLDAGSR